MARSLRIRLIVFAGSFALVAAGRIPPAQTVVRFEVPALLTAYAAGRFDEALNAVRRAGDSSAELLRLQWGAARSWIDADPGDRRRRYLAAAALVLETEILRADRNDWATNGNEDCASRCVLDWAGTLLIERGDPDEAERLWRLAAIALAEGVRDWVSIHAPIDARHPFGLSSGSAAIALKRFPDDPHFLLDRALAVASRFSVTTDGEQRSASGSLFPAIGVFPELLERTSSQRQTALAGTVAELTALAAHPAVGAEARVRLGYLLWATGNDERARVELAAATEAADKDVRYLAQFLLGHAALTRGQATEAASAFRAALEARPHSESASLALASLELQRGDADKAYALARDPFDQRRGDVDPWRQFLYGRYPQLPALVTAVRAEVTR